MIKPLDQIIKTVESVSIPISNYPYDLVWNRSLEIGYLQSTGYDYGKEYWQKYQSYINDLGEKLSLGRAKFVIENIGSCEGLCDVGIGSGQFVDTVKCKGYDVNPFAKEWLKDHGNYADIYKETFSALSFWDVLEHIDDPSNLLEKTENIFVSVPIHKDINACLVSKHLRPSEHIWHFTDAGFKNFMSLYGFQCKDTSNFETVLGREDIMSYYFKKI